MNFDFRVNYSTPLINNVTPVYLLNFVTLPFNIHSNIWTLLRHPNLFLTSRLSLAKMFHEFPTNFLHSARLASLMSHNLTLCKEGLNTSSFSCPNYIIITIIYTSSTTFMFTYWGRLHVSTFGHRQVIVQYKSGNALYIFGSQYVQGILWLVLNNDLTMTEGRNM